MRQIYPYSFACLAIAIVQILSQSIAQAATITVNSSLDTTAAANACTLRDAIANINAGSNLGNGCSISGTFGTDDTIDFLPGLAGLPMVLDGGELSVTEDLAVKGLGSNSGNELTTIDANDNSRVMAINNTANVSLNDLTLTRGHREAGEGKGGGVYISSNASLTLNNAIVSYSHARVFGGGIYAEEDSALTLNNSKITYNSAEESGGGIYTRNARTKLNNHSSVSRNSATLSGGGIFNTTAETINFHNLTIDNSDISQNTALEYGGGIESSRASNVIISNSQISGNIATLNGGGIRQNGDWGLNYLTISNTHISNNTSSTQDGGGIAAVTSSNLKIMSSFMASNRAGELGGAIYTAGTGKVEITNSTFSHNDRKGLLTASASIFTYNTELWIKNSTIVGGAADASVIPRGIHAVLGYVILDSVTISGHAGLSFDSHKTSFTMRNTILGDHTACQMDGLSTLTNWGGVLAKNDANNCDDFAIEGQDPILGPLQNNGGMVAGWAANSIPIETLALLPGSPAINAGINGTSGRLGACLPNDQRGEPRSDGMCDIGAYEVIEGTCYVIKSSTDKTVIFCL